MSEYSLRAGMRAPMPRVALVGREQERERLRLRLLEQRARLVTLTGSPGVGKTLLAQHTAADLQDGFAGGAAFIALDGVRDPQLVPGAVLVALGLREEAGRTPVESLQVGLQGRAQLLVLDNFEQVLEAASFVGELLAACPQLALLVTSRTALGLRGEVLEQIEPLPLPDASLAQAPRSESAAAERAGQSPAVELFAARARAVQPALAITPAAMREIVEICRRLDGLPLAIELAAIRSRALSLREIAAHLQSRLGFLTGGYRDMPPRQRTLRAAIDWSYTLLSVEEQRLLRALGVFATGASLDAIEIVMAPEGEADAGRGVAADAALRPAALETVTSLIDQSLVRRVELADGTSRYTMLETIREFAREKLAEAGETVAAHRRLTAWLVALLDQIAAVAPTQGEEPWVARLDAEQDNVRQVFAWTLHDDPALGLRIAARFARYWQVRGLYSEGRHWLERLLARADSAPLRVRALALQRVGVFAEHQTDLDAAVGHLEQALQLFREIDEDAIAGETLNALGLVAWRRAQLDSAREYMQEALTIARRVDRQVLVMRTLNNLAVIAIDQGRLEEGRERLEESLALAREQNSWASVSERLNNLARVAIRLRDLDQARAYAEEALALDRRHGIQNTLPSQLRRLAEIMVLQGDAASARRHAAEALSLAEALGSRAEVAEAHEHLARAALALGHAEQAAAHARTSLAIAAQEATPRLIWMALERLAEALRAQDDPDRALRLYAAAERVREATGEVAAEAAVADVEAYMESLRNLHGESAVQAIWSAGWLMPQAEAIAYALSLAQGPNDGPQLAGDAHEPETPPERLTARQVEVLRLLASGQSNASIAARLVISERTVEHHITSIYQRIGVNSRVEATAYALRYGLMR